MAKPWSIVCRIGSLFVRFVFLPLYTVLVLSQMRLEKTLVSARGFVFFLLTNRYVFHVLLFLIALGTIGSQLRTKQVAALDAGQNSLLYSLVTQGQEEVVEEDLHASNTQPISYLGADTLQPTAGGIDDDSEETDMRADLTIPGNIAVQPSFESEPEEPISPSPDAQPAEPVPSPAPNGPRNTTETYTVRSGDTVASIAQRFQVDINTVLWANNLGKRARITPGDNLRIPAQSGVLHLIKKNETVLQLAALYAVPATDIYQANHLTSRSKLSTGQEILIPKGTPRTLASAPAFPNTSPAAQRTPPAKAPTKSLVPISTIRGKEIDAYIEKTNTDDSREKPADVAIKSSSKLQWPTVEHVINQYYGWKHTGLDINGFYTDGIFASEAGTVIEAGWNNGGYGLQVVIDHGNGIKTRYAHASKLFVKVGDAVKRGETIAMVGTTGRSTGTHLHYEVYVNGKRTNPLAYIR